MAIRIRLVRTEKGRRDSQRLYAGRLSLSDHSFRPCKRQLISRNHWSYSPTSRYQRYSWVSWKRSPPSSLSMAIRLSRLLATQSLHGEWWCVGKADIRPDPTPDATLELPLLTSLLTVKMPDLTEAPQVRKTLAGGPDRPRAVCSVRVSVTNSRSSHLSHIPPL
jgi:hypothetical protein